VEDIHATNHSGFVHVGKFINSPRDATNLGCDLDEDLVDDGAKVLTLGNSVAEHNLRGNRELSE